MDESESFLDASPRNDSILESGGSSEDEYERMTAAEVLEKLEEAWINEKFSPAILEHKTEIVNCIMLQIEEMEKNLSHQGKDDFVASIHRMELERVRYVLCSYLRTRLKKIEKFVTHILEEEKSRPQPFLSPEELAYAKAYADSLDLHFHTLLLRHMPPNCRKLEEEKDSKGEKRQKAAERPNLDQYVFMKAIERKDQVVVDPEEDGVESEAINLLPGSQYILRYQPVSSLVSSGAAKLI